MEFLKKHALVVLTTTGILLALIFYSLNIPRNREANVIERTALAILGPVLKPASMASNLFGELWDGYISLVGVHQENRKLREMIKDLNTRVIAGNEAVQDNQRLSRLLGMKESVKAPTLSALVVGEDFSPWFRTLIIDQGSSSGLREGMAVIAADGVVGQTIKVSADTSRVLLLTDHASGIAATIQRSRARGVVKGKGEGLCSLEFTKQEEDVKIGDQVVASGIGGVFLKGTPIGEVTMVKRGQFGIFQTVTIRPAVNVSRLEEVIVVLRDGI